MKQRKDGRWQRAFTVNGKRICFYSSESTEKKAIRDIERQLLNYREKEEKGKTFEEVADEWAVEHYRDIAYNTQKQYKPAVTEAIKYFSDMYINEIASIDCQKFISFISVGRAKKTVTTRLLVLNLIMKFAVIKGYRNSNPCLYVTVPKGLPKTYREMASDNDVDIIKKNIDIPMGMYAFLILYTGCRRNEACALTVSDIDFKKKEINITKSIYTADDNKVYIKEPKSKKGYRKVILLDILYDKLQKYVKGMKKTDILFPNDSKGYMNTAQFEYKWKVYKKTTGIQCTPHMIRHSYASMLLEAGIDIKIAQDQLGHATMQMTVDTYAHISDRWRNDTAIKLNNFAKAL